MTIDYSKIKAGDVVGVRVTCLEHSTNYPVVDTGFGPCTVRHAAIVSHTPAPRPALKVGDRVMEPESVGGRDRCILWIQDGWAYFVPVQAGAVCLAAELSEVEQWERV